MKKSTSSSKIRMAQKFQVKLEVQYETKVGETVAVLGDIDELGNWTD